VLSPVDVSVPGIIECRPITYAEAKQLGFTAGRALIAILQWIRFLP